MRSSKLIDGVVWDGKDPAKYADGFKAQAAGRGLSGSARWSVPSSTRRRDAPQASRPETARTTRPRLARAGPTRPTGAAPRPPQAFDWRGLLARVLPPLAGLALLVGIWGC